MRTPQLIDARLVLRTAATGTVLQLLWAGAGHAFPSILYLLLFGRMMLSATAGYLYGLLLGQGYGRGALGGAIAGGLCVVPGLAASILLGDTEAAMLTGAIISVLTGAVGGAFGQMGAILKRLGL